MTETLYSFGRFECNRVNVPEIKTPIVEFANSVDHDGKSKVRLIFIISAKMRKPNSFSVRMILKTRRRKFCPDYKVLGEVTVVNQ